MRAADSVACDSLDSCPDLRKEKLQTQTEPRSSPSEREVFLRDGRKLVVSEQGIDQLVEIRNESGMLELRIRLTEQGPVLQMESVRLQLKATESVEIESQRVEIKGTEQLELAAAPSRCSRRRRQGRRRRRSSRRRPHDPSQLTRREPHRRGFRDGPMCDAAELDVVALTSVGSAFYSPWWFEGVETKGLCGGRGSPDRLAGRARHGRRRTTERGRLSVLQSSSADDRRGRALDPDLVQQVQEVHPRSLSTLIDRRATHGERSRLPRQGTPVSGLGQSQRRRLELAARRERSPVASSSSSARRRASASTDPTSAAASTT